MVVHDLTDSQGRSIGFEVDHAGFGRRRASRVLFGVPGARPIRAPKPLSWIREEAFCEAEVGGVRFVIEEPFGDNSRYRIGPVPPAAASQLAIVRTAFAATSPTPLAMRAFVVLLFLALVLSVLVAPW